MNILFVVPYTPTLIRVRPYNLVRAVARRGHRITLATLWETSAERQALAEMHAQGLDVISAPLTRGRTLWNSLKTLPTHTPLQAMYCWQPNLGFQVSNLKSRYDVAHVEHLRGAPYALCLKSQTSNLARRVPIIWDSVDCITHLFEQAAHQSQSLFGKLITRLDLSRTRQYEGWLVRQFDRVLVTSEKDKKALEEISDLECQISVGPSGSRDPKSHIAVLPNGVDLEYFQPIDMPRQPDTLVFSGKMSYHANITAALYLANEVMPLVWAKRPGVRLIIAGSQPSAAVRNLAKAFPTQVKVTGYVSDLRVPLCTASVAIAPLRYGAGIQNKVLEAMACRTPVVASPLAVSALKARAEQDCLVADSPLACASAILRLLGDESLRERIGAAGRRYVETYHNWDSIAGQLEAIYERSIEHVRAKNC